MMSLLASILCAVLFPRDVLDEIWDLIESVPEGFLKLAIANQLSLGFSNLKQMLLLFSINK